MTKEQEKLLEEAKQRFPPGTKFKEVDSGKEYTLADIEAYKSNSHWLETKHLIVRVKETNRNGAYLYLKGQWAEIISKPKSNTEEKLSSLPDKWCIKITKDNIEYLKSKRPYSLDTKSGYLLSKLCNDNKSWYHIEEKYKEYEEYSEITLEEFKKWVIKEDQPSKDKPFYVVVTEENQEILSKWRFINLSTAKLNIGGIVGLCLWNNKNLEKGHNSTKTIQGADYTLGNEISFEQFLELYPECKEDVKSQFEVGKWYKFDNSTYIKFEKIEKCSSFNKIYGETIFSSLYRNKNYIANTNIENKLVKLTDLSEIQEYLPYEHVDKYPKYVEIISQDSPSNWYKVGQKYQVFGGSIESNKLVYYDKSGSKNTYISASSTKPITKEEFENKPKSLVGRYVKYIKNNEFKDWIYQITSEHQSGNSYDATRLKDNSLNCYLSKDSFELLPEDYVPLDTKKVTLEKDDKMFKKDDYIVSLHESKTRYFLKNNIYFQNKNDELLSTDKDSTGGYCTSSYIKFIDKHHWRYATSEEIAEYNRIGKPYDVTALNTKKDNKKRPLIQFKENTWYSNPSFKFPVYDAKSRKTLDYIGKYFKIKKVEIKGSNSDYYNSIIFDKIITTNGKLIEDIILNQSNTDFDQQMIEIDNVIIEKELLSDTAFKSYEYEVVHCKTQEQWDFVNSKLIDLGYQLPPSDWNSYKENSCKELKDATYSGLDFFESENCLIYSFEEWCNKFNHKPNFNNSDKEKLEQIVEKEWIPKVGEWIIWKTDSSNIPYELTEFNPVTKGFKVKHEYGNYIHSDLYALCRKASPHEIPNYISGIDPVKSDDFVLLTDPSKKQTIIKTELDLIPIKQLKTFNN